MAHAGRLVKGASGLWQICVGLEVHAQIITSSKLFSDASATAKLTAAPNTTVSLFDAAHPGTLPQLNRLAVEHAVRTAMALRCSIHKRSWFERKHYFYQDLPAGYQITQLAQPFATGGFLLFDAPVRATQLSVPDANKKNGKGSSGGASASSSPPAGKRKAGESVPGIARIARIQLEQDSGKSVHTLSRSASLVDLNRAGVGLLEVVTEPDLRCAEEAGAFLRKLQAVLRHIGSCDGAMEEGAMRCDVNVSVRRLEEAEVQNNSSSSNGVAAAGLNRLVAAALRHAAGRYGSSSDGGKWVHSLSAIHQQSAELTPQQLLAVLQAIGLEVDGPVAADLAAAAAAEASTAAAAAAREGFGAEGAQPPFGGRVEMKNLNSIRAVLRSIEHEAVRQITLLEGGGGSGGKIAKIERETRLFDATAGTSRKLRSKEEQMDYRFMPEPDLAPLLLSDPFLRDCSESLPLSLDDQSSRLTDIAGLSAYDAAVLVGQDGGPRYFTAALAAALADMQREAPSAWQVGEAAADADRITALLDRQPPAAASSTTASSPLSRAGQELAKMVCNWTLNELMGRLESAVGAAEGGNTSLPSAAAPLPPGALGQLVALVHAGTISGKVGKTVLGIMLGQGDATAADAALRGRSPRDIVIAKGWQQLNDRAAIAALAAPVVADPGMADSVAKWKAGHDRVLGAFVQRVIESSGGRANPAVVAEVVTAALGPQAPREKHVGRKEKARQAAAAAAATGSGTGGSSSDGSQR